MLVDPAPHEWMDGWVDGWMDGWMDENSLSAEMQATCLIAERRLL